METATATRVCRIALSGKRGAGLFVLVSARALPLVSTRNWHLAKNGYVKNFSTYLHRLVTNAPKGTEVDHKNFDRLDCTDDNLRVRTPKQNRQNMRKLRTSAQPFKGIRPTPSGKYEARIRKKYIGTFPDAATAAKAYDVAAIEAYGEMACLNFPQETAS